MTRFVTALCLLAIAAGISLAQDQKSDADPHLARGMQLMQQQLFESAANEFQQAVTRDPANPRARLELAVCLLSLGRNEEARREFEKLQKQTGESRYITYYLGRLDLLSDDYKSAIQRLGSVAEHPPFPDTAFYLGTAYISSRQRNGGNKLAGARSQAPASRLSRPLPVGSRLLQRRTRGGGDSRVQSLRSV